MLLWPITKQSSYKVKKIKLLKKLEDFYQQNKDLLTENYPGLNYQILKNFIEDYGLANFDKDPEKLLLQLKDAVPFAYILGRHFFYDFEFHIDKNVLIPRFETEILVHCAAEILKSKKVNSFLDLGVGSGAIFINLLKVVIDEKIDLDCAHASDISTQALDVCRMNLEKLDIKKDDMDIQLIQSNRYENLSHKYDLIVSNPPYIKYNADKKNVHFQTDKYEPHLALYLKDSEYDAWFDDLFVNTFNNLNSNGVFLMEGHEDHLEHLKEKWHKYAIESVEIINDLNQSQRVLKVIKE